MISQRRLIAGYNEMIAKMLEEEAPVDKINIYTCEGEKCNNVVKTKDLVAGTTPFMVDCVRCGGKMKSSMYSNIPKEPEVTMEWYRPDINKVLKLRKKPGLIEHILLGGLMLRPMKVERKPTVLDLAFGALQTMKFKNMPTNQEFYDRYTDVLREVLELGGDKTKIINIDGK